MPSSGVPSACASGPARKAMGGFTLIEILCVLVIMGILSASVVSRTGGLGVMLPTRVEEIRSSLRAMQLRALKENNLAWGISASTTEYWAFNGTDPTLAAARIALPGETAILVSQAGKGISITPFTWYFDRYGVPFSTSGKLTAPASITITTTADGQSQALTVAPVTGFIP